MPKFNMKRKYPYPAEQVYAVAADVGSYNKFIPLVRGSRAWDRKTNPDGTVSFKAALTIVYKKLNIKESIQSDMKVDPKAMVIYAKSEDGALKMLDSVWKVLPLPDGTCEVEMDVEYALKSKMMQVLISGVFDMALRRIANALGERVEQVYGAKAAIA